MSRRILRDGLVMLFVDGVASKQGCPVRRYLDLPEILSVGHIDTSRAIYDLLLVLRSLLLLSTTCRNMKIITRAKILVATQNPLRGAKAKR
jgi:hypothetical protein